MEPVPTPQQIDEDLILAGQATKDAVAVRRRLRHRTRRHNEDRQKRIETQVQSLARHGSILRSHLKRSDHHLGRPYTRLHRRRIKRLLREMRVERQNLRRMVPVMR